jgi:isocitrate dehydrogenase (NAD+)
VTYTITLIPGDGIGPEVTLSVVQILETVGLKVRWEEFAAGANALPEYGTTLPEPLLASIRKNKIALKGPIMTPIGEGFTSVNVGLRKALQLYANLRPVWNLPSVPSRFEDVDLVIVRENTEDLYSGLEHEVVPGVVESLKIITAGASTKIARFAFEYARRHKRKRVTAVHKANIMKLGDGLFIDCARKIAKGFPEIQYDERIVDAACMHLVMHPERFDVLLLPNLYGDIVSDLCAGLVGGLGVVPAANLGEDGVGVFEAVHGTAPDIAGQNKANPTALLLSAVLMLQHLGDDDKAERVTKALWAVLADGSGRTVDIGGSATTTQFTEAICRTLQPQARPRAIVPDEVDGRDHRGRSLAAGSRALSRRKPRAERG